MTKDLREYIDGLRVQVYRIVDGSVILAEKCQSDSSTHSVILRRPLQICQLVVDGVLRAVYIPWIPGSQENQVKFRNDSIIAEVGASFDQKLAYSRYYLMDSLQKYLPSDVYAELVGETEAKLSSIKTSSSKISSTAPSSGLPNTKTSTSLKQIMKKQKRFDLN